jgi:hypothetical protein
VSEVLLCVGDSLLDASLFGLDITDCASLAAVSRDVNAAVAANPCWRKALSTLEHDFPLVFAADDCSAFYSTPPGSDDSSVDCPVRWRQTLCEPRYDVERWEAASTQRKFGLLLSFAQATVKALRQISLKADEDWFNYQFDESDFDVDSQQGSLDGYDGQRGHIAQHLVHIQTHYPERYDIVVKLAIANIAEQGFHEADNNGHDEYADPIQPYYAVDDSLQSFVARWGCTTSWIQFTHILKAPGVKQPCIHEVKNPLHILLSNSTCTATARERDCSFGFCSSFRDWMNDLTFCDDCGTDAHLHKLNQSVNFKPTVTISMLSTKLYRSIRVLLLPVVGLYKLNSHS